MDVHQLEVSVATKQWEAMEGPAYTLKWTALVCAGSIPSKRSGMTASVVGEDNNIVVVFGGGTLWTDDIVHNDVHTLDLTSREWTRRQVGGQAPAPRQGHVAFVLPASTSSTGAVTAAAAGTDVVLMGGSNNTHVFYDLHVLHTDSWVFSTLHLVPCPFSNLAGMTLSHDGSSARKVFMFGGASWQDLVATVSSDVFELDYSAGAAELRWERSRPPSSSRGLSQGVQRSKGRGGHWPHSRFGHAACFVGSTQLLVHGGWGFLEPGDEQQRGGVAAEEGSDMFFSGFKVYDTRNKSWSDVLCRREDFCRKRFGHKMFFLSHLGVVLGMCGNNGLHPLDDCFLLSLQLPPACCRPRSRDTAQSFLEDEGNTSRSPECISSAPHSAVAGTRGLLRDFYCPVSLSEQMRHLLQAGMFSDVKFEVCSGDGAEAEASSFSAHRCVLAARSEVFMAMLGASSSSFREATEGVIRVTDTPPSVFAVFLQCLYGAEARALVCCDQLLGVLRLASRYQVLGLKHDCEVSLCGQASASNVVSLLGYADELACPYLLRRCFEVVASVPSLEHQEDILRAVETVHPDLHEELLVFVRDDFRLTCSRAAASDTRKRRRVASSSSQASSR